MTKIAFIGAGSLGFTSELVRDILTFPLLKDATISLMDIDPERLEFAKTAVTKTVTEGNYPAKVDATLNRAEALKGADVVLTDHPGGQHGCLAARYRDPQEVRRRYQCRRHARAVRHFPRPAHDHPDAGHRPRHGEAIAPTPYCSTTPTPWRCCAAPCSGALYHRPPGCATACRARRRCWRTGSGADLEEITYTCAGINHQAWYLDYKWNGEDAYPLIHKAITEAQGNLQRRDRAQRDVSCVSATTSPSPAGTTPNTTGGSASART